jgi:hypothetical protein
VTTRWATSEKKQTREEGAALGGCFFFLKTFSLILNEKRDILVIFKEVDG